MLALALGSRAGWTQREKIRVRGWCDFLKMMIVTREKNVSSWVRASAETPQIGWKRVVPPLALPAALALSAPHTILEREKSTGTVGVGAALCALCVEPETPHTPVQANGLLFRVRESYLFSHHGDTSSPGKSRSWLRR